MTEQEVATKLNETMFAVEADSYAQLKLWQEFNSKIDWKEERSGVGIHVGTLAKHPVVIALSWVIINGNSRVMFWEATSEVVSHKLIKEWLDKHCKCPRTDAMNFHHVLHEV